MLQAIWEQFQAWLGLGLSIEDVGSAQMALRTIVVFAFTLAIVRLGSKRFLGKGSAFDAIVAIMLGSIMSRAINGSAPFFPTLAAGVVLLGLHWLLATLAFQIDWFGTVVKGEAVPLIKDGQLQPAEMRRTGLSRKDLEEALRLQSQPADPSQVKLACLERDGSVSVIADRPEPRILTISVADGVQTVRIELS